LGLWPKYINFLSHTYYTPGPSYLWFGHSNDSLMIYKFGHFSLCTLVQSLITFSLLAPNILSTIFKHP
jgi:hypothetical protein